MNNALDCIEIEPQQPAKHAVIWLHGLGADGHDFVPIVEQLDLPKEMAVRFVFPHAPLRQVTLNAGATMRAWFDIVALNQVAQIDFAGIQQSEQQIIKLIQQQVQRGIPANRIILAGFSQGGTIALLTALRYPKSLAGIIGLSTFLIQGTGMDLNISHANQKTPIFMAAGQVDPIVNMAWSQATCDYLKQQGCSIDWQTYVMPHSVCEAEIIDIRHWLIRIFD